MSSRTIVNLSGGALLLLALGVQLDAALARRAAAGAPLPPLPAAEMRVALGSCPSANYRIQAYCQLVTTCGNKPNPAECCIFGFAYNCPTTNGWQAVGTGGSLMSGNPTTPNCPTQASMPPVCKCQNSQCVELAPQGTNCPTGGTYNQLSTC